MAFYTVNITGILAVAAVILHFQIIGRKAVFRKETALFLCNLKELLLKRELARQFLSAREPFVQLPHRKDRHLFIKRLVRGNFPVHKSAALLPFIIMNGAALPVLCHYFFILFTAQRQNIYLGRNIKDQLSRIEDSSKS